MNENSSDSTQPPRQRGGWAAFAIGATAFVGAELVLLTLLPKPEAKRELLGHIGADLLVTVMVLACIALLKRSKR